MGYTKRQLVEGAFAEIGMDPEEFDLPASLLQHGLRALDRMMATWNTKGIRLAYFLPSTPEASDLDTESGIPDSAWEAVVANLALRIAPSRGKTPSRETKVAAKTALNALMIHSSFPPVSQPRSVPVGAGNKPWQNGIGIFTTGQDAPLRIDEEGDLEFT